MVLVCDCGGGTVDLTTYLVKRTEPSLDFEELAVGQGGKVGSTYIDRQFHLWMGSRFGHCFEKLPYKKKGPGSDFMKRFEQIKRNFGGDRSRQEIYKLSLVMREVMSSEHYDADDCQAKIKR